VGRRQRQRGRSQEPAPQVEPTVYDDGDGNQIVLRGVLSASTRASYARIASGEDLPPAATVEDAWQRAVEFLFERLTVSWSIAGAPPLTVQRDLIARLRVADAQQRSWLRERLREHCAEHFPDVAAP
jgi:hypothetical protein